MNLNLTENSQMLPDKWSTVDKVTANKIKANGMKGDFMSIVQRRQPVSTKYFQINLPVRLSIFGEFAMGCVFIFEGTYVY